MPVGTQGTVKGMHAATVRAGGAVLFSATPIT